MGEGTGSLSGRDGGFATASGTESALAGSDAFTYIRSKMLRIKPYACTLSMC